VIMRRIYLDHAATTPARREVMEAMLPFLQESFGNPSSPHTLGREAKEALEAARLQVAGLFHAEPAEIVFTSGGTEADNFALCGVAWANREKGDHIITTAIEHHAVLNACKFLERRGFAVTYLPVDRYGLIDTDQLRKAIRKETIIVSIMQANNEVGTIEPIEEIAAITRERGIFFHTDAVQTCGHLPIDVRRLEVDLLSSSAHKLYGPKGVGALYIRQGTRIVPFLYGGEQEQGRRASTENVAGIVGFGKAAELAGRNMEEESNRLVNLRDRLIRGILESVEEVRLNGDPTRRLPGNASVSISRVEGEALLLQLDMRGVCASTGSACNSRIVEPSHVLTAMGTPEEAIHGSLRLTLGRKNLGEEIDYVLEVLPRIVGRLRAGAGRYRKGRV